jgi:hypothetical protein
MRLYYKARQLFVPTCDSYGMTAGDARRRLFVLYVHITCIFVGVYLLIDTFAFAFGVHGFTLFARRLVAAFIVFIPCALCIRGYDNRALRYVFVSVIFLAIFVAEPEHHKVICGGAVIYFALPVYISGMILPPIAPLLSWAIIFVSSFVISFGLPGATINIPAYVALFWIATFSCLGGKQIALCVGLLEKDRVTLIRAIDVVASEGKE